MRESCRAYRLRHPERRRASDARSLAKRKDKKKITSKLWYIKNRDRMRVPRRAYYKRRRIEDVSFKIAGNLRTRLGSAMRRYKRGSKSESALRLLGCSMDDFRIYLESKFEPDMNWENYGRGGWHIDHIMPCVIFDLANPEHQKRCFHFSNLQPLWELDNLVKNKYCTL